MSRKFRTCKRIVAIAASVGWIGAWAQADQFKIQPDEANSKDVITYEFAGSTPAFGVNTLPNVTNLDTDTLAVENPGSPIGALLATTKTSILDNAIFNDGVEIFTGHSVHTWIQFDLPPVAATDVISATLNLWALDGQGITNAFENPSTDKPVVIRAFDAANEWDEQTITWETEPDHGEFVTDTTQDVVEDWVTLDVTSVVVDWLEGSKANHGLFLDQQDVVLSGEDFLGVEDVVASLFSSSAVGDGVLPAAFGDASKRPFLEINTVPDRRRW